MDFITNAFHFVMLMPSPRQCVKVLHHCCSKEKKIFYLDFPNLQDIFITINLACEYFWAHFEKKDGRHGGLSVMKCAYISLIIKHPPGDACLYLGERGERVGPPAPAFSIAYISATTLQM